MLLAIDVGNTSSSFAVFLDSSRDSAPIYLGDRPTNKLSHKVLNTHLRRWMTNQKLSLPNISDIYISSVVPHIDAILKTSLKKILGISPHFVSAKNISAIKVKYSAPNEVGADRIVNARAAIEYHKGPLIVVDFGTATTFDCISKKNEYLGGVIAPGPVISAEALYQKTAKLPHVVLTSPAQILGKNTLQSIESGLYHGYRGLVKEIIWQLKSVLGQNTYVMATGGQAEWILKGIKEVDEFVSELTLLGLYFLWKDQTQISVRN